MGELYLWSAPLSHTEVAAISVGFHPTYVTSASLVAWYPLEEGEGDRGHSKSPSVEREPEAKWTKEPQPAPAPRTRSPPRSHTLWARKLASCGQGALRPQRFAWRFVIIYL